MNDTVGPPFLIVKDMDKVVGSRPSEELAIQYIEQVLANSSPGDVTYVVYKPVFEVVSKLVKSADVKRKRVTE